MRRLAFVFILLLAGGIAQSESVDAPLVAFSKLRPSYTAGQRITFTVTSRAATPLEFACTAEALVEGKWREALYSVNGDPRSKSIPLLPLKAAGSTQRVTWDTAVTKQFTPPGRYRLKVEMFEPEHLRSLGIVSSAPFTLARQ